MQTCGERLFSGISRKILGCHSMTETTATTATTLEQVHVADPKVESGTNATTDLARNTNQEAAVTESPDDIADKSPRDSFAESQKVKKRSLLDKILGRNKSPTDMNNGSSTEVAVTKEQGHKEEAADVDLNVFLVAPTDKETPELLTLRHAIQWDTTATERDTLLITEHQIPVEGKGDTQTETITARVYRPVDIPTSDKTAVLVYYHGGGWVIGNLNAHDLLLSDIAEKHNCTVVSVGYRLAPKYKFPIPFNDCYAATQWVVANADSLGIDVNKFAVGGDSAGGNLAAAVTLKARDEAGPKIHHQILIYPVMEFDGEVRPSWVENDTPTSVLSAKLMDWFWLCYFRSVEEDAANPLAAPLRAASLADLPPALVILADNDILRDQGRAYAEALQAAAGDQHPSPPVVVVKNCEGMEHGFMREQPPPPPVADVHELIAQAMKSM